MWELLGNSWRGWIGFISEGKHGVLFLGVLCFLWLRTERGHSHSYHGTLLTERHSRLFRFAVFVTVLVIYPLTAAVLIIYQTKFYDYKWLWGLVPMTIMIAYGSTEIYLGCYEKYWKGKFLKPAAWVLFWCAVLLLSSGTMEGIASMVSFAQQIDQKTLSEEREDFHALLEDLTEDGNHFNICLWAPKEVLMHVRTLRGDVQLLYGRNMWDASLNGYSYDTYDPEVIMLYEWMESLKEGSSYESAEGSIAEAYIQAAVLYGVNRILFPDTISVDLLESIEKAVREARPGPNRDAGWEEKSGYYIFRMD